MKDLKAEAETWVKNSIHNWTPLHVESLFGLLEEVQGKRIETAPYLPDLEMVSINGGNFLMGADDEKPAHSVQVSGFYMGKFLVTQRLWQAVMGGNPSSHIGDRNPVEQVSWDDVQSFLKELNKQSGGNYRLPTEAEWEYACRANDSGKYCGGDNLDSLAWYDKNSGYSTHPVGGKQANKFGLYDMSGNVWEWCNDWYGEDYYAFSPKNNPIGPATGTYRVLRGGSSFSDSLRCRSVYRNLNLPEERYDNIGFRLVLPFQAAGS